MIGDQGAQGSSTAGPAGPMGRQGPAGTQGIAGDKGVRGETLTGPTGPVGRSGVAGEQGVRGQTGAEGSMMAGVAGVAGRSGPAGPQGSVGPTGAQGAVGVVDRWTSYREFRFDYNRAEITSSDRDTVSEIATYIKKNPSLQVGLDGSMDARGTDPRSQNLSDRRVAAVRDALIQAGVPAQRIQVGAFGDERLKKDRRVEVLISTR